MAYSILAGLPPEVGLYASIAPPILYAFFGSSRALAVGPVAVASLMVASTLSQHAAVGTGEYYAAALILAFLIGSFLILMGVARLGFMANFLSHPVMSGFTSAAAIIIAFSQLANLFVLQIPRGLRIDESLFFANAQYLENFILSVIAEKQNVKDIVLICSAVNAIDTSALESLENLAADLGNAGVILNLAEVKGPVMDRLSRTNLFDHLGNIYLSTHDAFTDLKCA